MLASELPARQLRNRMNNLPTIATAVLKRRLTYLAPDRLASLFDGIANVKDAKASGDFVEFGVALGGAAICIASELPAGSRFIGYDVFGMIPPPGPVDGESSNERYEIIIS